MQQFFLVLNNAIPLAGVLWFGWDWLFFVQFCIIENYIASIFDLLRLFSSKPGSDGRKQQGIDARFYIIYFLAVVWFMPFLYTTTMAGVFDVKLLPWKDFILAGTLSLASHTVQFIQSAFARRTLGNSDSNAIFAFGIARSVVIMASIILAPLFFFVFPFLQFKMIVLLIFLFRSCFEITKYVDKPATVIGLP